MVGVSSSILHGTRSTFPHYKAKYLYFTCEFLKLSNLKPSTYIFYVIPRQRERDEYIMDIVLNKFNYTDAGLYQVNHIRLFLQVLIIVEITNVEGNALLFPISHM